jgi:hypothetical protein
VEEGVVSPKDSRKGPISTGISHPVKKSPNTRQEKRFLQRTVYPTLSITDYPLE